MEDTPSIPVLVMWMIGAIMFATIGMLIARAGVRNLWWDRKTGYWIYQQQLKKTGNEEQALAAAAKFYRVFGGAFAAFAALHFVIVFVLLVAKLWS